MTEKNNVINEKSENAVEKAKTPATLSHFSSKPPDQMRKSTILRNGIVFVVFLLIFFLCINGVMEKVVGNLIMVEEVSEQNHQFLKRSLLSATGHFAVLSLAKGGVSMISNTNADIGLFGTGASIPIGEMISPVSDTLDAIWRFFGYSMAAVTAQMAILKFFKLISFKILVSTGALLIALSAIGFRMLKRFGTALIIIGFILYALMPYTVYSGKILFEESNMESSIALSEDLGVFKERIADIDIISKKNLTLSGAKETFADISLSLSQSVEVVLSATVKYFSNMIIMFIITPIFFYGLIYISSKKVLAYVEMEHISETIDTGIIGTWGKMWKKKDYTPAKKIKSDSTKQEKED